MISATTARMIRLTDDGITQWHPAFLALGQTLEICAAIYRQFCQKYKPQPKPEKRHRWGSKLLAKLRARGKPTKQSPGQKSLWPEWDAPVEEISRVSEKFVLANCFNPKIACLQFDQPPEPDAETASNWDLDNKTNKTSRCQVTDRPNPDSS